MKRLFNHLQLALVGLVVLLAASCKNEKLADVVTSQSFAKVNMSVDSKIEIGKGSTYTLSGADLTIPFTITFSSATTTAFAVNLSTNVDTVAQLVTAGTLPAGTAAFTTGAAAVLPQITIPAGVKTFTTNIIVSRSVMELFYSKNVAAVIKIGAVGKGNTVVSGKGSMILVVKPYEILDPNSVHEIYFQAPGTSNIVDVVSYASMFSVNTQTITFSVPVVLQGDAGAEFTVDAVASPDSVTKYINNGKLPNSVLYPSDKITTTQQVKMQAGANVATFTFDTKINTILAVQPAPAAQTVKMPTVAFTLKNASKYKVSETVAKRTVYLVINPNFFRPYYGTPFLIKGAINAESAPIYGAYYDFGGEGVAYHNNTTKNGDGSWRLPDYVDVSGDYTPRSVIGWNNTDEWLTYSVNVEETGVYEMNIYAGSSNGDGRINAFMDNVLLNPTVISVTNTGSYGNQVPHRVNVNLTKGYHIYKVYWVRGSHDYRGTIFTRKS